MKIFLLLLLLLLPAGCTMPRQSVDNFSALKEGEVVLVGKLSINRKLPESTHVIDTIGLTEGGLIRASNSPLPFLETKPGGFEHGDILAKWGKIFSVPYERHPVIFVSGIYAFTYEKRGQITYAFPVMGSIRTRGQSRFLYIGHLDLKIDEFFTFESIRVIDEFKKDKKALSRFKGIRKSLFVPNI